MNTRFARPAGRPAEARCEVRSALEGASSEVIEVAELLTSELVTNAISYGSEKPTLTIQLGQSCLRIEVQDANPTINLQPLHVEASSLHGRGLAIVDALASSWGVERRDGGKAVWFQLNL